MRYISCVSDFEGDVEFEGHVQHFIRQPAINISQSLWHKTYCLCCGECCKNFNTVFSAEEYKEVQRRANEGSEPHKDYCSLAVELPLKVNGVDYHYVEVPPMSPKDPNALMNKRGTAIHCRYIDPQPDGKKFCRIHEYRSVSCGFPHLELRCTQGHTPSLLHVQYGRNWALGCPVDLKLPEYDQETYENDVYWLTRLYEFAESYNIPTMLPQILEIFSKVDVANPPTENIRLENKKHLLKF